MKKKTIWSNFTFIECDCTFFVAKLHYFSVFIKWLYWVEPWFQHGADSHILDIMTFVRVLVTSPWQQSGYTFVWGIHFRVSYTGTNRYPSVNELYCGTGLVSLDLFYITVWGTGILNFITVFMDKVSEYWEGYWEEIEITKGHMI